MTGPLEGFALQATSPSCCCSGMTGKFSAHWGRNGGWFFASTCGPEGHLFIVQSDQEKIFHEKQNQPRALAMDLLTTTFGLFSVCPFTCHQGWWKIFVSAFFFFPALPSGEAHPLNVVGRLQRTCRKRIILESSNTPWTEKRGCFDTTAFTLPLRSQENGKK